MNAPGASDAGKGVDPMNMKYRFLICLLALMLALASLALADIQRGDYGEEVKELQQKLLDTGYLSENPDGVFGAHTEKAVMAFQKSASLPISGRVDGETLSRLEETWRAMGFGDQRDFSYYMTPRNEDGVPLNCYEYYLSDGSTQLEYCEGHTEMHGRVHALLEEDEPDKAKEACQVWKDEIDRLYTLWLDCVDESQRPAIAAARTLFFSSIEAQENAITGEYSLRSITLYDAYRGLEPILRRQVAWLCMVLADMNSVG